MKEERQAAVEAILKAGHIPAGMELFAAGNDSQLDTIRRWIDESDVYMLILGGRYGSVDLTTALSYTELEYDYAASKGIPLFTVVITDSALDKKVKLEGKLVIETEHPKELNLFRTKVLNLMSSFFDDIKDIKLAVHETLLDFMGRIEFKGWVSGTEVAESAALVEELSRLRKQNIALEKEVTELKKNNTKPSKIQAKWADEEFQEIISLLAPIGITTTAFNKDEKVVTYPLLNIVKVARDQLITGVTNKHGSSNIGTLLYYNVCPKLEVHGLAALEKVASVQWRRYRLTPKGMALLAFMDKKEAAAKKKKVQKKT